MAKRNQTETGSVQSTNTEAKNPSLGYKTNVRRDDSLDAAADTGARVTGEEIAHRDIQNDAIKPRDQQIEKKLPSDPLDPDLQANRKGQG